MVSKGTKSSRNATKTPALKKSKQTVAKSGKPRLPTIPPGLEFIGYREQLLGSPGPSQPHRRMRRWWLRDGEGKEHAAVETTQWDEQNKRFEYCPSQEFAEMLDMKCYSHKSVYEYLDLFLHPEKYVEVSEIEGVDTVKKEKSPVEAKKRKRALGGNDTKGSGKANGVKESVAKKKATGNKNNAKKSAAKKPSDLLKNVSKELATLQATYGIRYTLTVIGPHGDVKVISSPTVERIDIDPHEMEGFSYPQKLNMLSDAVLGATEEMERQEKVANDDEKGSILPLDGKQEEQEEGPEILDNEVLETHGEEENNKGVLSMDTLQVELLSGLKTLVSFVKDSEDSQYLPGSFWRRDPFPSTGLQNARERLEIAPDAGQLRDIERVKHFLTIEQRKNMAKALGDLKVYKINPSPCSENDFVIAPVWGIDTYTRGLFDLALASCHSGILSREKRNQFFTKYFLPCLNKLEYYGWDTLKALETIGEDSNAPEEFTLAARDAMHILQKLEETGGTGIDGKRYQPLRPSGRKFSRSHPKGDGVILRREEGLKNNTFIGQYVGDLYTSWRFFEKDSSKTPRTNTKSQSILNTYTMTLERPNVDKNGYSVLYIDVGGLFCFVGTWMNMLHGFLYML